MTFVVAEVGSNWTSFEDCLESIALARECGADAVKFQLFTGEALYGKKGLKIPYELPKEWLPRLKLEADKCDIEFMCTAFSPELLQLVDPFVKRHKIASCELTYDDLIVAAAETGKPLILSTGASSLKEIRDSVELFEDYFTGIVVEDSLTIMYCIAAYPAVPRLPAISILRQNFDGPVGFSCHSESLKPAVRAAVHYGATVIEKHFKIRDMKTPDAGHSLMPNSFQCMVELIKQAPKIEFPDPQEKDTVKLHKRRMIDGKCVRPWHG